MKRLILISINLLMLFAACKEETFDPDKTVYVTISTTMGDVTIMLYDDTPLHKTNFIKLCQENMYEGVIFHRVIKEFVVQGGDPTSKAREAGVRYGDNDGGYTVPAEILPKYFNKKGALIDAKEGDDVNWERASAGTQFCFVQGSIITDEEFAGREDAINKFRRNWLYYKFRAQLKKEDPSLEDAAREDELHNLASIMVADTVDVLGPYVIPEGHRQVYKTIGGVPHLDGMVTIFGEVVEGFDIVEKISLVNTDEYDRPVTDVVIKSTRIFN